MSAALANSLLALAGFVTAQKGKGIRALAASGANTWKSPAAPWSRVPPMPLPPAGYFAPLFSCSASLRSSMAVSGAPCRS